MKALISILLGTWLLALGTGLQAQTKVVTTDQVFSRAEIDQMLAPIALYPDTVLSHILIAATYPLEVVEAERWIRKNRHLEAEEAVNAAYEKGWDPSVAALTAFPDILQRMSEDLEWTQNLGDAFLADEGRMMDAIQNLREKAYASGHLRKMKHVKVHREKQIIILEPATEQVVYIPYYDTRVVYGNWWWDRYPPAYWHHPSTYVHISGFHWGPSIHVGTSFFFSAVHWPQRRIVVIDRHHHHPHFYSARKIVHYHGARHWHHDPHHRRNVVYRSEPVRVRYANVGRHHDAHNAAPRRIESKREIRRNEPRNTHQRDLAERRQEHRSNRDSIADRPREGIPHRTQIRRDDGSIQDRANRSEKVRERLSANRSNEQRAANQNGSKERPNRVTLNRDSTDRTSSDRSGQWRNRDDGPRSSSAAAEGRRTDRAERGDVPQRVQIPRSSERRQESQQARPQGPRESHPKREFQSVPRADHQRTQRQDVQRPTMERREIPHRAQQHQERRTFDRPHRDTSSRHDARPEHRR